MKNITTKILLLLLAIALAVGAVLYYMRTIVEPPHDVEYTNALDAELGKCINEYNSVSDNFDYEYWQIMLKINRYINEGLISDTIYDQRTSEFNEKYIPLFIDRCNEAFQSSVWDKPNWSHTFMRNRIKELSNAIRLVDGTPFVPIESTMRAKMSDVIGVLDRYDEAYRLVKRSKSFFSLANTRKLIDEAEEYRSDYLLSNCKQLCNDLQQVRYNQKIAHKKSLITKINNLECNNIYDHSSFCSKMNDLLDTQIKEYEDYYHVSLTDERNSVTNIHYWILDNFINMVNWRDFSNYDSYLKRKNMVYEAIDSYRGTYADKQNLKNKFKNNTVSDEDQFNRLKHPTWYNYYN